jgi:hypothetical protein
MSRTAVPLRDNQPWVGSHKEGEPPTAGMTLPCPTNLAVTAPMAGTVVAGWD